MQTFKKFGGAGLFLAFSSLLVAPGNLRAQTGNAGQAALTLNDVKDRLKQNQKYLDKASKRGKAGDTAGLQTALANYGRGADELNHAMSEGRFSGTASQRTDAFNAVERATAKHTEVLRALLNKVPEQARPAIQHAMEVSGNGRTVALQNLQRGQGEPPASKPPENAGRTAAGPPQGAGQPIGGVPAGGMGGSSGGRPAGGPPSGTSRGPR